MITRSHGRARGGRRFFIPRLVTFCTFLGLVSFIIGAWALAAWPRSPTGSGLQQPKQQQHQDPPPIAIASEAQTAGATPTPSSITKPKVLAVIGVFTGYTTVTPTHPLRNKYDYVARRRALRATWFPPNREALARLEAERGVVLRFVVGSAPAGNRRLEGEMAREEAVHGGFLRLPLEEHYKKLTFKTVAFLRAVIEAYNAEYIIKADDDIYLRLDRVPPALVQWQSISADYVGCMKSGPIYHDPRYRWHEPKYQLFGASKMYPAHAWGTLYALSGRVAADLAATSPGALRFFANEDVTIGAWMLAFNVTHYDDRRLCEPSCSVSSIATYDMPKCAGLCSPAESLPAMHASPACALPAVDPQTGELPLLQPLFKLGPDPKGLRAAPSMKLASIMEAAIAAQAGHGAEHGGDAAEDERR